MKCYFSLNLTSVHIWIQIAFPYVICKEKDMTCYMGNTSIHI